MSHHQEIADAVADNADHMAAHGKLCSAAMGWSVQTIRAVVEYGEALARIESGDKRTSHYVLDMTAGDGGAWREVPPVLPPRAE